jgi:hypothetical protein
MPQGGSFLDKLLLGIKAVWWNGTPVTPRPTINFLGGVVADNSGLGTTDVTLGGSSGGGGGVTTVESNGTAQPLRTAINFVGFDVTDDSPHNRTNVTLDLANSSITGVLSVPQGGTGAASFTAHAVLLGGGSGPITTVASSADGDVLTLVGGIPAWAVPANRSPTTVLSGNTALAATDTWVLFVAGPFTLTAPAAPIPGQLYEMTHTGGGSLTGAGQVTLASGAAYTITDPQNPTGTPASSVKFLTDAITYRFRLDGLGVFRCVN